MVKIIIKKERCKACGLCISACPKKILQRGEEINTQGYFPVVISDENACTACGLCALICPDVVFEIYKEAS